MIATWLMVDHASARLMSSATRAASPAPTIVTVATTASAASATGAASSSACSRARTTTPAATMVAAWMSAETGVGPSMASGSQPWNGNWADLPITPTTSSSAARVAVPVPISSTCATTRPIWLVPVAA